MSGMFDKKTDKAKRKLEQTQKEQTEKRKTRRTAIIIIAVLLVVSAVAITLNSNFVRRTLPVVTIDGVSFTTAEFEYFVNVENMEHVNLWSQMGMEEALPDPERPLSTQTSFFDEDMTWADYFIDEALTTLTELVALYNAANASGFELTEEQIEAIDEDIEMIALQAAMWQFPSADSLLQIQFGNAMNVRVYREILEFISIAGAYNEHVRESFEYSEQELITYYNEHRDDLDFFNFRQVLVQAESIFEEDFENDDIFSEALQNASNEARLSAYNIIEDVENEDDFIVAAGEYNESFHDPVFTIRQTQGENLADDIRDWLIDDARDYGDTVVIEMNEGQSFSVLFYISRDDNNYQMVGMRQILLSRPFIDPSEFLDGEDDPAYLDAVELAEQELHARGALVRSLFETAGGTEAALLELMDEHSDDHTEGGYYPNIAMATFHGTGFNGMRVVTEIEEWLFDESRTVGDWELIYTEAFGYHLVYFTGFYDLFFEAMAADLMRTDNHSEWIENLHRGVPERNAAFFFVQV
ncbi:MAG: hypothetical protein FWD05_04780 [Oscillospiraceae bacterium]|nr:hypothetical protein [Oscillospiraceae bacterium]